MSKASVDVNPTWRGWLPLYICFKSQGVHIQTPSEAKLELEPHNPRSAASIDHYSGLWPQVGAL